MMEDVIEHLPSIHPFDSCFIPMEGLRDTSLTRFPPLVEARADGSRAASSESGSPDSATAEFCFLPPKFSDHVVNTSAAPANKYRVRSLVAQDEHKWPLTRDQKKDRQLERRRWTTAFGDCPRHQSVRTAV